jgi:hypothetical protein
VKEPEILILTFDENGEECWTNPPSRNISEVWDFIERFFKNKYIKAFLFMNELKCNKQGRVLNTCFHNNPKYRQLELF